MKKARLIFLASLVFMAFSAFKGDPHAPGKNEQSFNHLKSSAVADSLNVH